MSSIFTGLQARTVFTCCEVAICIGDSWHWDKLFIEKLSSGYREKSTAIYFCEKEPTEGNHFY